MITHKDKRDEENNAMN